MVSFRGKSAPPWVLDGIRAGRIGAVCLFAYNVDSLGQLRELNLSLRAAAAAGGHPPPLIGIDQEGGQLMAVTVGATELPGNMALGAAGSADLAHRAGQVLGRELRALGCNLNFAPVLDLASRLDSHVVGVRAFGDEPGPAAALGVALLQGLQSQGVLATAKHFPGHGATQLDSHHTAPVIERSLAELREHDLPPFLAARDAGVAAMMSAHVVYPALDSRPATQSPVILRDLLRRELGFDGLVITDAMDMLAVAGLPPLERCVAAAEAGADLVLLGHLEGQEEIVAGLARVTSPDARRRIAAARASLHTELPPLETVGSTAHRDVARACAEAALTVVRGSARLELAPGDRLLVITFRRGALTPADSAGNGPDLAAQLRERHADTVELAVEVGAGLPELVRAVRSSGAKHVVIATVNASDDPLQVALVRELCAPGIDPVVVSLRSPLDAAVLPWAANVLCTYGWRRPQTEAAARALLGDFVPSGRLPVTLPPGQPSEEVAA